jgi:hypothetical protein
MSALAGAEESEMSGQATFDVHPTGRVCRTCGGDRPPLGSEAWAAAGGENHAECSGELSVDASGEPGGCGVFDATLGGREA